MNRTSLPPPLPNEPPSSPPPPYQPLVSSVSLRLSHSALSLTIARQHSGLRLEACHLLASSAVRFTNLLSQEDLPAG
jgi:hypothetical protein